MISDELADFAAGLALDRVPEPVALRAKHLILDALGCALAARGEPFAQRIAASVARLAGEGPRRVVGLAHRLPLRDAALVNGMLMHGLDYDDTHAPGVVHLTVSVLPAALAAASQARASGAALLAAYVAGMEAGARIAAAAKGGFHQAGFHPTAVVGTFAATLAAGRLMGLARRQLAGAQGIALSFASGTLQFLEDGSWTKRIHPGWAAAGGLTAAALARDDIEAPREPYEGRFGLYRTHLGDAASDLSVDTAALGSVWEVENVAVKPFPACHLLHACTEAAITLHREGLEPQRIRSVRARVPEAVIPVICEPLAGKRRPRSDYEAKFSLPYAVASGLVRGRLGLAELVAEALTEPRLLLLMDKIEYEADPDAQYPRYYSGEVEVRLDDGRVRSHRVAVNPGNPERPLSNAEVEAKYLENCARTLDAAVARRIRNAVLELETLRDCAALEEMLAAP